MATVGAMAAALAQAQQRLAESVKKLVGNDKDLLSKVDELAQIRPNAAQPQIAQTQQLGILADILDAMADKTGKAKKEPEKAPEKAQDAPDMPEAAPGKGSAETERQTTRPEVPAPSVPRPSGHKGKDDK